MKIIGSILLALIPFFATAQFSKGQIYLGGTFSTSLQNNAVNAPTSSSPYSSSSKNTYFSASPIVGYFLNQKIAIGASIGYSSSFNQYENSNFNPNDSMVYLSVQKNSSRAVNINSFVKYYFPISSSFYFALQGQINFSRGITKSSFDAPPYQNSQQDSPSYSLGMSIRPVFIYFPSAIWGIEAGLGSLVYSYSRVLPDKSSGNNFSINGGTFSFGLAYYFARKAK